MKKAIVPTAQISGSIRVLRGERVLLDFDLAALYGVTTSSLNRAVKRNRSRFPRDFMFQLSTDETKSLRCQFGISKGSGGGFRYSPHAFTEQGVAMLSSVLRSERAVKVNIAIMRAFVKLREALETNRELARKFNELEKRVDRHGEEIDAILQVIRQLMMVPEKSRREIGFHVRETAPRFRRRNGRQP